MFGFRIGEVSCPTKYFKEASSISFRRSVTYGLGVLRTTARFLLHKHGLTKSRLFEPRGRKVNLHYYSEAERVMDRRNGNVPSVSPAK